MNPWERCVVPNLIACACATKPIMKQRAKVVPKAEGVVLELGCGSGTNFAMYDAGKVEKLYALEPAPGMVVKRAARRAGWVSARVSNSWRPAPRLFRCRTSLSTPQ